MSLNCQLNNTDKQTDFRFDVYTKFMELKVKGAKLVLNEENVLEPEEKVYRQLNQYLNGERREFNLELDMSEGFTQKVLNQVNRIPYGQTRSYSEIAEKLDSSAVAVGQACGRNPIPLIIPCHRVVGKNSLGGYKHGKDVKAHLLDLESEIQDK